MRSVLIVAGVGWLVANVVLAETESRLPVWKDGERSQLEKEGWIPGGELLGDDVESKEPQDDPLMEVGQPTAEELAENVLPPEEVPAGYWAAYFEQRPESYLVDPQGLLGPTEYRDRLGFLNYHAGDSSIDLYVYVFKGDQDIPGEVREEELVERFFSEGRPAAVVYYYLGAPKRSVLYLSPVLTDGVSAAEQRRALESSVIQALHEVEPAGQLESFLVQMSIRIYWMERMLGLAGDVVGLPSVAKVEKLQEKKASPLDQLRPIWDGARGLFLPAGGFCAALGVAVGFIWWMRRRTRLVFPELDVEPRLGGAHAAGVGAVISFASAALPPASQRDQTADYLRRV